eukprot:341117-Chlamydomonas_euryale.AAC.1
MDGCRTAPTAAAAASEAATAFQPAAAAPAGRCLVCSAALVVAASVAPASIAAAPAAAAPGGRRSSLRMYTVPSKTACSVNLTGRKFVMNCGTRSASGLGRNK